MANCMIGFPNRVDASTLSGGSWIGSLPLANVKSRVLGKVARSTDATLASTIINIDCTADKNIRLFGLVNHNFSLTSKVRIRGASDSGFTSVVVDTGFVDVWSVVFPYGELEWEDDNWFDGRYTQEQREGYTASFVSIFPRSYLARYWRIEINDTSNAAGYVDIGRVFFSPAWQPSNNMEQGASIKWNTKTDVQEAIGGAEYFQVRTPFRQAQLRIEYLGVDEMLVNAFEIDRRAGIDQEVFWIHDPDDTVHALRRQFLARLSELTPVEWTQAILVSKNYNIKELL